jgi:hypothetical protein
VEEPHIVNISRFRDLEKDIEECCDTNVGMTFRSFSWTR